MKEELQNPADSPHEPRSYLAGQTETWRETGGKTENGKACFIKGAALGTAVLMVYSSPRVLGANDRVRVGVIGFGGRAQELVKQVLAIFQRRAGGCRRYLKPFTAVTRVQIPSGTP